MRKGQDAPRLWSHCANGLRSHDPQPGSDRWWSTGREGETDCWCAVCNECGYLVWLTPDWEKYPSRTTTEPQLRGTNETEHTDA